MTFDEYEQEAMMTAKCGDFSHDLMHVALGLTGEGGEIADAVKKHVIYAADLDKNNIIEELGDVMWYVALGCRLLGVTMEEVTTQNVAKLRKRHNGGGFTKESALAKVDQQSAVGYES